MSLATDILTNESVVHFVDGTVYKGAETVLALIVGCTEEIIRRNHMRERWIAVGISLGMASACAVYAISYYGVSTIKDHIKSKKKEKTEA